VDLEKLGTLARNVSMRIALLLCGSAIVFLLVQLAAGAPVRPWAKESGFRQVTLDPFGTFFDSLICNGKERTNVIVYGQGTSPMAVYVYDAHGNCVARDDLSLTTVSDDLAVEWHPPTEQVYDIEIRNLGRRLNNAEIAIR
jgi:hypothetical protein